MFNGKAIYTKKISRPNRYEEISIVEDGGWLGRVGDKAQCMVSNVSLGPDRVGSLCTSIKTLELELIV